MFKNFIEIVVSLNCFSLKLIKNMAKIDKPLKYDAKFKNIGETALGIEKTKGVCGGSACIIRTRIPVWTLVSLKNQGASDAALLDAYPSLRQQDLNNAWAYYKTQKKEIDLDIKENHEA
jgi:uncharacterized protein (DUF433 family)